MESGPRRICAHVRTRCSNKMRKGAALCPRRSTASRQPLEVLIGRAWRPGAWYPRTVYAGGHERLTA
jgi:hypothetical protein